MKLKYLHVCTHSLYFLAGESINKPQNGAGSPETIPPGTSGNVRKQSGNKLARISFDDYITTWTGIATSKARSDMKNPCEFIVTITFHFDMMGH